MMILVGWCYVFNLWVITLPVAQVAQLIIDSANQEPAGTQLDFFSKVTWGVVSSRSASRWVYKGSAGEYLWTFRWVATIPTFLVWSSFICPWCRVCKCSSQCMWGAKYLAFVHQDACSITTTKIRDKHPGGQFWDQCLVMESAVERCVGTLEPCWLLPVEGYPSHLECPGCSGTQECRMAVVLLVVEHHAGTTNATWHPCFRSSIWSLWTQQLWGTAGSSSLGGWKPSVRFAWSGLCLVLFMWMSIEFTYIRIYKDYTVQRTWHHLADSFRILASKPKRFADADCLRSEKLIWNNGDALFVALKMESFPTFSDYKVALLCCICREFSAALAQKCRSVLKQYVTQAMDMISSL